MHHDPSLPHTHILNNWLFNIAFNTAVGLAEYENERDANQKVVFHVRHLEQVVKMSRAFQEYLGSTHGMSLADQARHHRTRNDYWKGPSDRSVGSGAT